MNLNSFDAEKETKNGNPSGNFYEIRNIKEFKKFIHDKTVSVIGLGISNLPLILFLRECGVKNIVARDKKDIFDESNITHDAKNIKKILKTMNAQIITGENYLENLKEDVIFKTPGIRRDLPQIKAAEENGSLLTSEMEVFFNICPAPIYAVTGSAGKTTTTTIIGKILETDGKKVHIGGNIGRPLLNEIENIEKNDYVVLELSSFQLFDLANAPSPHKAIITNITPNHLDWHKSMEEYSEAKEIIFKNQVKYNKIILNYDDNHTLNIINNSKAKSQIVLFSQSKPDEKFLQFVCVYLKDDYICVNENSGNEYKIIRKNDIFLKGTHNLLNFMAAIAILYDEVKYSSVEKVARNFGGVEHRQEFVREKDGIEFYNSSIDSSPLRTVAALERFGNEDNPNVIIILGGRDKNLEYEPLVPYLNKKAKKVILYGEAKGKILNAVDTADKKFDIYISESFSDAVVSAYKSASGGDIVLLSPACTSFDCFINFEERGNAFKQIVHGL